MRGHSNQEDFHITFKQEGRNLMNRRQREKFIPSTRIIAAKQSEQNAYYVLYAIDWKRRGRLSWEGCII